MRAAALLLAAWVCAPALAQEPQATPVEPVEPAGQVAPQVLTVDLDRIVAETAYGRAMTADFRARDAALQAENDAIAAEMRATELDLATRRASMEPDAFRAEAEAFDQRAESARAEQDAKLQALAEAVQSERAALLDAALPVLTDLMRERGGAVLIERGAVILAVAEADVTDAAIARLDAELGTGPYAAAP